jgi:hypothetical protein
VPFLSQLCLPIASSSLRKLESLIKLDLDFPHCPFFPSSSTLTRHRKLRRARDRYDRNAPPLKILQSPRHRPPFIHAVDLDPMATARDMKPPTPPRAHKGRLGIQRLLSALDAEFKPALRLRRSRPSRASPPRRCGSRLVWPRGS